MMVKISVVIPTYHRREHVHQALLSLEAQTLSPSDYEVIVAIDGSEDGTREMVSELAVSYRLQGIWQSNQGRAAACNTGVRAANGEIVVILDDDMQASVQLLAEHWHAHQSHERCGIIGAVPIQVTPETPPVVKYVGDKFNCHLDRLASPGHYVTLRDFYTGNFSIRRRVLLDVGGYDEAFTIYGNEDVELGIRLRQAGVELLYSPTALAHQQYTKTFEGLARDTQAKGRTAVLLAVKHPETLREGRLNTYRQGPLHGRLLRSMLLGISRIYPSTSQRVIQLVRAMERIVPDRMTPVYHVALEYFFWQGVRHAIREQGGDAGFAAAARAIEEQTT